MATLTSDPTAETPAAPTTGNKLKRFKDIALVLLKYGGGELIDRLGMGHFLKDSPETALISKAGALREDLVALGPTFVKLGQLMLTRADLLPPQVLDELSLLQDKVEPVPFPEIRETIETELGVRLETLFDRFDPVPLGSASLGQVHMAVLRTGRVVGVKVQRPHIEGKIAEDMAVLRDLAVWLDEKTELGKRYRFAEIQAEFERTLWQELDYEAEAQNLLRLQANLAEFETIIVPSPVPDYCTKRVLTMDYVTGRKVTDLTPFGRIEVEGEKIADTLLQAYLKQVFVDGFFHADPHPGNVFLVDRDRVALIDLGMVGSLSPMLRRRLLELLPSIYRQDPDTVMEVVLEMSEVNTDIDRASLTRAYGALLQTSQVASLDRLRISDILFGIVRVSAEAGVHLPPEISLLGRTMLHLDRIGRVLAPHFNVNHAIENHIDSIIQQQMLKDVSPRTFFKGLLEAKDFFERLPARANRLLDAMLERKLGLRVDLVPEVHLLENLQKIANRITVGLILAALIVGASQFMQVKTRFMLFGYPGFAMICFLAALVGALILIYSILKSDRRTHDEASKKIKSS